MKLLFSLLFAVAFGCSTAQACEAPRAISDTVQVAWISPLRQTVGAKTMISVVRTADFRALVGAKDRDATAILRAVGMLGPKQKVGKDYKITLFDVKAEWLCRPIPGVEGEVVGGLRRCEEKHQDRDASTHPKAWTDCGYLVDVLSGKRTLDLYRLEWSAAATWGFCVMPLQRFLEGA